MQWFLDMQIRNKLLVNFLLLAFLAGSIAWIGIAKIRVIYAADTMLYQKMTVPLGEMGDMSVAFQRVRICLGDLVAARDGAEREKIREEIKALRKSIGEHVVAIEKTVTEAEGRKLLEEYKGVRVEYGREIEKVMELAAAERPDEARAVLDGGAKRAALHYQQVIDRLVAAKLKQARQTAEENTRIGNAASAIMIGVGVAGVAIALLLGYYLSRIISAPLRKGVEFAQAVASGDLSQKIRVDSRDELGQLAQALNEMVTKLSEVVAGVREASDHVAAGSQELSLGSGQMSEAASSQAAAAEEVSSSMEQMTANISHNADNATQTEKIAVKSAEDARASGEAVRQTVEAMRDITGKISIISEIARQTNLLALNAAIEAARAGEHGKGFAVVAAEVRKLAERSHAAAVQISELSFSSVEVAERAGQMLTEMVPAIQRTSDLVQEISASCREQGKGTEHINTAVQQLDHIIQHNASASEEIASTAEELSFQADALQRTIAYFRLEGAASSRPGAGKTPLGGKKGPASGKKALTRSAPPAPAGFDLSLEAEGTGTLQI